MKRSNAARPFRRGVCVVAALALLSGCAQGPFSTQSARIGQDDGTDNCRPLVVALDSTGNYFGADILQGAAIGAFTGGLAGGLISGDWRGALIGAGAGAALGGAAGYWSSVQRQARDQTAMYAQVRGDILRENVAIDRTQLAFDQLLDCRFRQASTIQADATARRLDRASAEAWMRLVKSRAERDLAIARTINGQIAGRAAQFEVAAENLDPGASTSAQLRRAPARPSTMRTAAALKLRPDAAAPDIGTLAERQTVTVSGARGGYVLVETPSGQRGYAPAEALSGGPSPSEPSAASPAGEDFRSLAGSNAARRDNFAQSVSVSEKAIAGGFELAG